MLELHYIALIVTGLLMENKSIRSKLVMKMLTFQCNFNGIDSREVSLNWNVYGFSVDYNAIDKCDILNIHKYLMVENNILNVWIFWNVF